MAATGLGWNGKDAKTHGPDLSGLAQSFDAKGLTDFLSQGGRVPGKSHWKRFWGNDEDLASLVAWLLSVPPAAPTPAARPAPDARPRG